MSSIEDLIEEITGRWEADGGFTDQTITRMGEIARRFARRLQAQGITQLVDVDEPACRGFIDAPTRHGSLPTDPTRYFRRVTVRAVFRTARAAGIPVADPTLDIALPPRSQRTTRPLGNEEILLARTAAFTSRNHNHRRAAAWALGEATASTAEIAVVTPSHFDDASDPKSVRLPGTRRVDARTVPLTEWGTAVIRHRIQRVRDQDRPLVYDGTGGEVARQAAICKLVGIILDSAGLTDPDVRPESLRLWRAQQHYSQTGDLVATALLLGNRSLDRTAEALGIDWRQR